MISEIYGERGGVFGGWMDEISRFLSKEHELVICYMSDKKKYVKDGTNEYIGFKENEAFSVLRQIIDNKYFDIYHIWGTEYSHSDACISILDSKGLMNKCVVSIQGLVSVYSKHYIEGLPLDTTAARKSFREIIKGNSINRGLNQFITRGIGEVSSLKKVKNVIGRTTWDKACIQQINNNIFYYSCNESLRKCFYDDTDFWDIKQIVKHTIFVSQWSYPVKGMHYILNAMPLILREYPDAKIITTGIDLIDNRNNRRIKSDSYFRYLLHLIDIYDLYNKIDFKGLLDAEQMKKQYLLANVYLSASTIENSPNSVGEAMILGCPVVASYVGGVMDMITHNKEGYLYQAGSVEMLAYYVCRIFEDEDNALKLSTNARTKALATHNLNKNNNDMMNIYRNICSRNN